MFSVFERFLGFLYRIFLSRSLGSEALGLYQITLSVVGVLVTLTASGTPITVSRLMMKARAQNDSKAEREVISAGIFTALILSLPLTIALFVFRNKLSFIFADKRCYDILIVILPSIVLTSVYAVIRGSFWGNKRFLTYSLIELIEEIAMLVIGVFLVSKMQSEFDGAISAGIAISISYVISFTLSTITFIAQGGKLANPFKQLGALTEASLPITVMRTATSLLSSLVAIIIPARLIAYGATSSEALSLYGELSGMALPLLFIPSTLIGSIALVLVPDLSENYYKHEHLALTNKISNSIKCSVLISCVIFPIFTILGKEIGYFVYKNNGAGVMLSLSSIMMIPMCLTLITTSILNSLNKEKFTLGFYLLGAVFMLASVWFLPKFCGVYALIAGHLLSYIVTSSLNLFLLEKQFSEKISYKRFTFSATICSLISCLFGYFLRNVFAVKLDGIALILAISLCILAFNFVLLYTLNLLDFILPNKKISQGLKNA